MTLAKVGAPILVIILTLLSGYFDSRGFLYASDIWEDGRIVFSKLVRSGLGFGLGVVCYWIALRFLKEIGIALSSEVQTLGWFGVTLVGVAISSGEILAWSPIDRFVAVLILLGIGWLLFRGY